MKKIHYFSLIHTENGLKNKKDVPPLATSRQHVGQILLLKASTMEIDLYGSCSS